MRKLIKRNIKIFEKILIIFLLFLIGFYSKSVNIERLSDKELIGPDPYLLYRYTKQLYETGKIEYPDTLRYYPFGIGIDNKAFLSYIGYTTLYNLTDIVWYFDNIFDVRFLPNPHSVNNLRDKVGENK
ncbi:MAG TPA: hypothetical protein EYP20_06260 [Aigarchaeota archaeon]|nr:hypothetical protein [Aigarchaeota archaeon]